jgi:hypothetical protein
LYFLRRDQIFLCSSPPIFALSIESNTVQEIKKFLNLSVDEIQKIIEKVEDLEEVIELVEIILELIVMNLIFQFIIQIY